MSTVAVDLTAFLSNLNIFFTQALTWLGDVVDVVVSNPMLLILCVGCPVVGFAVGLLGRLIRL